MFCSLLGFGGVQSAFICFPQHLHYFPITVRQGTWNFQGPQTRSPGRVPLAPLSPLATDLAPALLLLPMFPLSLRPGGPASSPILGPPCPPSAKALLA